MNRYQEGSLVRITGVFTDLNGNAQDPTAVQLKVTSPDGTTATYTVGTGVVKDSVGNYHYDADTTSKPGNFAYEWKGTGTGQAASSGRFFVYDVIP